MSAPADRQRRIVFYSDAAVFGGHDAMACHAIDALLHAGWECIVVAYRENQRFLEALRQFRSRGLRVEVVDIHYRALTSLSPLLRPQDVVRLTRLFQALDPDAILLLQGRIETAVPALLAARVAGIRTLSYVPCAHPMSVVAARKPLGLLRDWTNRFRYRSIGRFITCYEGGAQDIRRWAPGAAIEVVQNVCPPPGPPTKRRGAIRAELGLGETDQVVALVGRVEFRQKRQNVVVQHLHQLFAGLDRATLLIVGDGPDLHDLETLAAASPLAGRIRLAGWRDDVLDILQASDVLLLPSAYEGMPLTMLEALAMGIPVIASDVDGMSDMLPPEYLFPADSPARMHDVLVRVLSGYRDHLDELRRACSQMTLEVFRTHFAHAITTLLSLTEDGITNA